MLSIPPSVKLWFAGGVDLRLGFDGLGGKTAAVLFSVVGTCKHLGTDPFAYMRDALPGLFALGENPTAEQLLDWLPDRWLSNRTRGQPARDKLAG